MTRITNSLTVISVATLSTYLVICCTSFVYKHLYIWLLVYIFICFPQLVSLLFQIDIHLGSDLLSIMQIPFNIGKLLSLLINLLIILNQILTELPLFFLL